MNNGPMSDDELRAFLESATVGGDDSDGEADAQPVTAPQPAAETPDPLNLPPTEPILGLPGLSDAASSRPAATPPPVAARPVGDVPSFDDIVSARSAEADLAPIVLPGPPGSRTPQQQAPVFRIEPTSSRSNAQAAPTVPIGQTPPPTAPLPAPAAARPGVAPQPLPTSQLATELGFDAPTVDDDYERISVTGGEGGHRRVLPWIVVAAVAAVALIASVFIVLAVRGNGDAAPPAAEPGTQTEQTPETPAEPTPGEEPSTEPTTPEPEPSDQAPSVQVGRTYNMDITQWNTSVEVSNRLGGGLHYVLDGDDLVLKGGDLLPKFPDSCAEMRSGFGMSRAADGSFEVRRPAQSCAAAPELYDEVWGLVAAMTESAKKS